MFYAVTHSSQTNSGKSHDSQRISSKSFYIHYDPQRKTPPYLYNSPKIRKKILVGINLDCTVSGTYVTLGMQFDQKSFPFKRNFPNFRPRKCVDLRIILKHQNPHMCNSQIQRHIFVVLRRMHLHPVQFASTCRFE